MKKRSKGGYRLYCPKCKKEIPKNLRTCPHCKHQTPKRRKIGVRR